jgi:hypothetical protein
VRLELNEYVGFIEVDGDVINLPLLLMVDVNDDDDDDDDDDDVVIVPVYKDDDGSVESDSLDDSAKYFVLSLLMLCLDLIIIVSLHSIARDILKMCVLWSTCECVTLLVCMLIDCGNSWCVIWSSRKGEQMWSVDVCTKCKVKIFIGAKVDCIGIG